MILLVTVSSFLCLFFLALSTSNILRAQQEELRAKIADRLKMGDKAITTPLHIERRERMSDLPFLDRIFRSMEGMRRLRDFVKQAGLSISLGSFVLFSLLLSLLVFFIFFLLTTQPFVSFLGGVGVLMLPFFYVAMRRARRIKRFSDRFADAIGIMASSLRAGHSLQIAFETVVSEAGDIVAEEFKSVLSEFGVGQNFEEALKGVLSRIDTPELRLFISAVVLQRETGGNLAELLDNLEFVIRERYELKRELKASTSQARLSGIILSLLPVFVALFLFFIHPNYILFFFNDPLGVKLLGAAIVGQMLGALVIQKIVHVRM